MLPFAIRRLITLIPILLGISLLIFTMLYLIPGDVARIIAGSAATQEVVESIRQEMGLNEPLHIQYWTFLQRMLRGDLGYSYQSRRPVISELPVVLIRTVQLTIAAQVVTFLLGGCLGIVSAVSRRSLLDRLIMTVSVTGLSLPMFWSALIIQLFFGVHLGWLPPSGYRSGWDLYLILPVLTLTLPGSGMMARVTRSAVLEVLNRDYIRTARAKGLTYRMVIIKHAVRNALIPMITLAGADLGRMMGGVIMVEIIFTWPGMGKYVYDALLAKDFPALQAATMLIAMFVVLINLMVDMAYGFIDPRIRYDDQGR